MTFGPGLVLCDCEVTVACGFVLMVSTAIPGQRRTERAPVYKLFPQKMEDCFVWKTASRVETGLCFQSHGSASMRLMVTRSVTHIPPLETNRNAGKQHCIFPHIFLHSRRYHVWTIKRGICRCCVVWSQMAPRHFTKRVRLRNISWPASWHCRRTLGPNYQALHFTALNRTVPQCTTLYSHESWQGKDPTDQSWCPIMCQFVGV